MKALRFLIYSNIWISLGAALLSALVFKLNGFPLSLSYLLFVFFSTLFSYNFQRITRIEKIKTHAPNSWIVQHEFIGKVLLIVSLVGALITLPIFKAPFSLFWLIILALVSGGYSYKNLRDLPYLKIIFIAVSWGIACGILPLIINKQSSGIEILLNFAWVALYILAITIPFDIRDIGIDEDNKKTIPQWVGINQSKLIGFLALSLSLIPILLISPWTVSFSFSISYLIASYLILLSTPSKPNFYFTFWIDGHIVLHFLLVFFLC